MQKPKVQPEDEEQHAIGSHVDWSESYYFNFVDPKSRVGGFTRIGIRPNEGRMDAVLMLFLPGGKAAGIYEATDCSANTDDLSVGTVTYELKAPLEEWRIGARGNTLIFPQKEPFGSPDLERSPGSIEIDLHFLARSEAMAMPPLNDPQHPTEAGQGHFEQSGEWQGSIVIDNVEIRVDGYGNRDKSWGIRSWQAPAYWRWFSANWPEMAAGGFNVGVPNGTVERAWIWDRNMGSVVASTVGVETTVADDGISHLGTRLTLTDEDATVHTIAGRAIGLISLPMNRDGKATLINEALVEWRHGDSVGYGIAEYLHQMDEAGLPKFAVV